MYGKGEKVTLIESLLAHKYARAFLNVYGEQLLDKDITALAALSSFLASHHEIMFYLETSIISSAKKNALLDELLKDISVKQSMQMLVGMLLKKMRTRILPHILHDIVTMYYRTKGTLLFTITSSHTLDQQQLAKISNFLAHQTNATISYRYSIDKKLIAGIRAQNETLLWEYSIRKQLKNINLSLIH